MLFELDRVTLERDGKTVLQDVSASLPKGASCIAGPSGSGKSTLLRLLNRLADPASGTVSYAGADVREKPADGDMAAHRRRRGGALFALLTGIMDCPRPVIAVLNALLPRYVDQQVYRAILESIASEQSARMVAMRNATDNARDLVSELTLSLNKARQAQITREVSEISAGAAALAG